MAAADAGRRREKPVPLDELESHLREDVKEQARSGVELRQAFQIAVERMGRADELNNEFKKTERKLMRKALSVLAGFVGLAVGMAFILPAAAWYHVHGEMPLEHLGFFMLGVAIVGVGMGAAILGFKKSKA